MNMNNDVKTTIFGVVTAIGTAVFTTVQSGFNAKSPAFWGGMIAAVGLAIKGYFTNKSDVVK